MIRACRYWMGKLSVRLPDAVIRLRKDVTMRVAGNLIEPEDLARAKARGSVSSQPDQKKVTESRVRCQVAQMGDT